MTNNIVPGKVQGKGKKYHIWKIGQINIQTCSDDQKLHLALLECRRANLDIICFQEVRLLGTDSICHLNYDFNWCGMKRLRRNGVAIAIRKSLDIVTNGIINVSDRLMAVDVTVKGCKLRIISCYAPTSDSSTTSKHSFYRELLKLTKVEKCRKLMIQGDFNCEPQFCRANSYYDGGRTIFNEGADYSNENVMLFLDFCQKCKLSILNTWFQHPLHHRVTWHHPNGTSKRVYDYSLSESWLRRANVNDVCVRNSFFHSDHRLVVTIMKTPTNKAARHFVKKNKTKKPDIRLLQDATIKENVIIAIQNHLDTSSSPSSLEETHCHMIEALVKGKEKVPLIRKQQRQIIPWTTDDELTQLHHNRVELRKQQNQNDIQENLKEIRKKIKSRVKAIQNKILKDKAKEINEAQQHRNVVKLWRNAKNHGRSEFKKSPPPQCPGLKEHFSSHFNPDQSQLDIPAEVSETPEFIKILQDPNIQITDYNPSTAEIKVAVNQLNNGKSALDIEAELFKIGIEIPTFMDILENYFCIVWTTKEVPQKWAISRITAIWKKKGHILDPTKYRGISIGPTLCKIAMNIILKRLSNFYEKQLLRTQFGFRSGLGCNDGIYTLKTLQDIAFLTKRKLYVCFIGLTAAFDHVNKDLLFKTIRSRLPPGMQSNNLDIVQNLYKSTKSYMQNGDPSRDSFSTSSGVRQGGQEGPPFYNYYSDFAIRVYNDRKTSTGCTGLQVPYHIPNEATNRLQKLQAPASGEFDDDLFDMPMTLAS